MVNLLSSKWFQGKHISVEFFTLREAEPWERASEKFNLKISDKIPTENESGIIFKDVYAQYLDKLT